jgi:hypothetical protein
MTGLLLLFVVGLWLAIVYWLTKLITIKLSTKWWRMPVRVLLFLAVLPLPLVDEIVGGRQFKKLCEENSTIQFDRVKAAGKTVYLNTLPEIDIKGTWVSVKLHHWEFVDVKTDEPVVSYSTLRAKGGRFIRTLGISEGSAPLIFKGSCVPKERPASVETFKGYGITYIEPPVKQNQENK